MCYSLKEVDMKETIEAIYENGLLRPLRKLRILEGQRIRLTVESLETGEKELKPQETPPYMKVRRALRACAGSLSDDVMLDREERA
jgi:predicted DNA-binding antitoxin AbrB/MazE fold protein